MYRRSPSPPPGRRGRQRSPYNNSRYRSRSPPIRRDLPYYASGRGQLPRNRSPSRSSRPRSPPLSFPYRQVVISQPVLFSSVPYLRGHTKSPPPSASRRAGRSQSPLSARARSQSSASSKRGRQASPQPTVAASPRDAMDIDVKTADRRISDSSRSISRPDSPETTRSTAIPPRDPRGRASPFDGTDRPVDRYAVDDRPHVPASLRQESQYDARSIEDERFEREQRIRLDRERYERDRLDRERVDRADRERYERLSAERSAPVSTSRPTYSNSDRPCKFGAACYYAACKFLHPPNRDASKSSRVPSGPRRDTRDAMDYRPPPRRPFDDRDRDRDDRERDRQRDDRDWERERERDRDRDREKDRYSEPSPADRPFAPPSGPKSSTFTPARSSPSATQERSHMHPPSAPRSSFPNDPNRSSVEDRDRDRNAPPSGPKGFSNRNKSGPYPMPSDRAPSKPEPPRPRDKRKPTTSGRPNLLPSQLAKDLKTIKEQRVKLSIKSLETTATAFRALRDLKRTEGDAKLARHNRIMLEENAAFAPQIGTLPSVAA